MQGEPRHGLVAPWKAPSLDPVLEVEACHASHQQMTESNVTPRKPLRRYCGETCKHEKQSCRGPEVYGGTYVRTYTECIHVCVCLSTYVYAYMHIRMTMYVFYIYVHIYTNIHVYIYV